MSKSTRADAGRPVEAELDPEVVEFRANFEGRSPLDELIREGAQRMLQTAVNAEVEEFIARHADRRDEDGRRQVVRNGYLPAREIMSASMPGAPQTRRERD